MYNATWPILNVLYMYIPKHRNNSDNADLVENAATLLMELAKYRKFAFNGCHQNGLFTTKD